MTLDNYTVRLRSTANDCPDPVLTLATRAKNGDAANAQALALAARISARHGHEYRVARVDPA